MSRKVWDCWSEAAVVTLERFHPAPPPGTSFTLVRAGDDPRHIAIVWAAPDDLARGSHDNEDDATRDGAYVIAAIALFTVDGCRIQGRAQKASGADLLMLRDQDDEEDFVKLEVSGVAKGTGKKGHTLLRKRLQQKIEQVRHGDLDRPGVAAVVGFELGHVLISEVQR